MMLEIIPHDLEQYAWDHTQPEPDLLQQVERETQSKMEGAGMLTGRLAGRFLKLVTQISGARRVLEIGMFTGYSALSMAEALPPDGELITCEIDVGRRDFAQRFFALSPHGSKITIRLGPALETLKTLAGPFDLAFIDADKENYPAYYERVMELLRPGGLILVDNTLWDGQVLKPEDEPTRAIDQLNRRIAADTRVENVLLTVRDGMQLVRKKG